MKQSNVSVAKQNVKLSIVHSLISLSLREMTDVIPIPWPDFNKDYRLIQQRQLEIPKDSQKTCFKRFFLVS